MSIGPWQLLAILVVVLIVFGAGKLPRVMGDIGKGVRSMKQGLKGDESDSDGDADKKHTSASVRDQSGSDNSSSKS